MTSAVHSRSSLPRRAFRVLIAPATLLERTRGWQRVVVLMVYGLVFGIVGLFAWRAAQLAGLPNVGDPFDVAAFEATPPPKGTDAVSLYLAAQRMRRVPFPDSRKHKSFYRSLMNEDRFDDPMVKSWLDSNRPSLDLLRRATSFDTVYPPRKNTDKIMDFVFGLTGLDLIQLCLAEDRRQEHEGDLAKAWDWYRIALRVQRHLGNLKPLHGREVVEINATPEVIAVIDRWATRSDVDAALLRHALDDVKGIDAILDTDEYWIKNDYINLLSDIDNPSRGLIREAEADLEMGVDDSIWYNKGALGRRIRWFAKNEPERSRRVLRLIFANWLARQGDPNRLMSPYQASTLNGEGIDTLLLDDGPESPASARVLPPQQLAEWYASTALLRRILPDIARYPYGLTRRAENQNRLQFVLAEQLYIREHGVPPRHAKDLVPGYLDHVPDWFGVEPDTAGDPDSVFEPVEGP